MDTFFFKNATEIWQRETSLPSIPSFSQAIDNLLGYGGFRLGSITEIIGLPGTGKTQMCLQLCASVQIPEALGGLNSEALFIDTNTNFTIWRFQEISLANQLQCQKILGMPLITNCEEVLSRLHYVNAYGLHKFCAFMYKLPKLIEEMPKVKLIVIDSIAFPFKEGISPRKRTGLLFRQMAELQRIAVEKQIAIVLTNELSTRLGLSDGTTIVGALGDAWSHRCNVRLLLTHQNDTRFAVLLKSNVSPNTVAKFQITKNGIRDVE